MFSHDKNFKTCPCQVFTLQGKAVESFQRLNFRVIAVGDSFNDARGARRDIDGRLATAERRARRFFHILFNLLLERSFS